MPTPIISLSVQYPPQHQVVQVLTTPSTNAYFSVANFDDQIANCEKKIVLQKGWSV